MTALAAIFVLTVGASIAGVFTVLEAREPRHKLAAVLGIVGFAIVTGAAIQVRHATLAAMVAGTSSSPGDVATLTELFRARSWLAVMALGGALSIVGVAILGQRWHRRHVAAALIMIVAVGVIVLPVATPQIVLADVEHAELELQIGWLVALALAASTVVRTPRTPSDIGFRRASRGTWLLSFTSVMMLGVSLGGVPTSDSREAFHAVAVGISLCMLLGALGFVSGIITAARVDKPRLAPVLLGVGAFLISVVAAGRIVRLAALDGDGDTTLTVALFDNYELTITGIGLIATLIGSQLLVRLHGIHELRNGFVARLVVVAFALAVTYYLHAASGNLGVAPSPSSILQGILRVVMCVVVARELGELANRINRAPELPTARATIAATPPRDDV